MLSHQAFALHVGRALQRLLALSLQLRQPRDSELRLDLSSDMLNNASYDRQVIL